MRVCCAKWVKWIPPLWIRLPLNIILKKENKLSEETISEIKDIDLKGLKPTFEDLNRPSVKTVDVHSKAENALKRKKEDQRDSVIRKIKKEEEIKKIEQ